MLLSKKKLQGHFTMSIEVHFKLSGNETLNKKVLSSQGKVRNNEAVRRVVRLNLLEFEGRNQTGSVSSER